MNLPSFFPAQLAVFSWPKAEKQIKVQNHNITNVPDH
jgi:hypothetical protein